MDNRSIAGLSALAISCFGLVWWVLVPVAPPALKAARPERPARPVALDREPQALRDLGRPSQLESPPAPTRGLPPPAARGPSAPSPDASDAEDGGDSDRLLAVIDRARTSIWNEGEEMGVPEEDIRATVERVEAYLREMDRIRTEVRSGALDRRDAKEMLTDARSALHNDLDALVGAETHEALRRAIPAKY